MRSIKTWLGVGLGLAVAVTAGAVEVQTSAAGVRYLSGGITAGEVSRMQAARRDYSFALRPVSLISGGPLIDATVRILRSDGTVVLATEMDGPWLLAALPPGRYKVEVRFQDETLAETVEISAAGQRELVLRFRSDAEVSALAARR
jgi:hypothetical protein